MDVCTSLIQILSVATRLVCDGVAAFNLAMDWVLSLALILASVPFLCLVILYFIFSLGSPDNIRSKEESVFRRGGLLDEEVNRFIGFDEKLQEVLTIQGDGSLGPRMCLWKHGSDKDIDYSIAFLVMFILFSIYVSCGLVIIAPMFHRWMFLGMGVMTCFFVHRCRESFDRIYHKLSKQLEPDIHHLA
jgi:hypothetical protein